MKSIRCIISCCVTLALITTAFAQEEDNLVQKDDSLMEEARNPLADMISLPFQYETYFGIGPDDETAHVMTIQPVYPVNLNDDWNLITRTLLPLLYVPESVAGLNILPQGVGSDTEFGLGDINFTGFFSPARPKGLIWGFGPSINFPTATDELLGSEKWSAGPSAVIIKQTGKWNFGVLYRHLWSFAGEDERADVNQSLLQPWVAYSLNEEWYVLSELVITANWEEDDSDERFVVPVGGGIGRLFHIGKQPVDVSLSYYHNIERPDAGAEDVIRFSVNFLWPK
jgi:hypothetical protein